MSCNRRSFLGALFGVVLATPLLKVLPKAPPATELIQLSPSRQWRNYTSTYSILTKQEIIEKMARIKFEEKIALEMEKCLWGSPIFPHKWKIEDGKISADVSP